MSHSRDDARPGGASVPATPSAITRREAILRVSALLGGVALVGSGALLTACRTDAEREGAQGGVGEFTRDDIVFLDEVADTILPETSTPGAKAAKTGAFMALMVTDTYDQAQQRAFREGMRTLDEESEKMHGASFMEATPQQRLALLERIDREAKEEMDRRRAAPGSQAAEEEEEEAKAAAPLPDQRQEESPTAEAGTATAITEEPPPHYFRMMKELALLGYFTSEIGYTQAMRYVESPGRFDPCVDYAPGEKAWAPHA